MKSPKAPSTWEPAPEGNHVGVICQLVDKGTQPNSNPDWEPRRVLRVGFDLVEEKTEKGKRNIVAFKDFTFSDKSKGLRELAKSFAGIDEKKFSNYDAADLMGKVGMIEITHEESKSSGNTYAKIVKTSTLPKGMANKKFKSTEPKVELWLDPDYFDRDVFAALPERIQADIASSDEYNELDKAKSKAAKKVVKKK